MVSGWDSELLDKVGAVAQRGLQEAQEAIAQGRQALDEWQDRRDTGRLLEELGAAYYAAQRTGGAQSAVEAALAVVDDHVATHGWVGFPTSAMLPTDDTDVAPPPPEGGAPATESPQT